MYAKTVTRKAMLLGLGALLAVTMGFAQAPRRPGGPGGPGGQNMIEQLKKRLNLTDEQVEKVEPILKENAEKNQALREKFMSQERSQETMQAMRAEREKVQEETDKKLAGVLTKEQMAEYEKMQQEMRERFGGRGPGGGRRPQQ